jgi:hypothetical protein
VRQRSQRSEATVPETELVGALFARIDAELGRAGPDGSVS